MKLFECAGFAEPLPTRLASAVRKVAIGIRQTIAVGDQHAMVDRIVGNVARQFDESIFLVGGWDHRGFGGRLMQKRHADVSDMSGHFADQIRSIFHVWMQAGNDPAKCWIEFGNELDGSHWERDPDGFFRVASVCYRKVREISPQAPFITGSVMNFNRGPLWKKRGYEVLRDLCKFDWPLDSIQGLHPYRQEGREWPSFASDKSALAALTNLLDGRRVAITEMGWRSGEQHTDEHIAEMMGEEIEMWRNYGAVCFCHYQIQDGPTRKDDDAYGAFVPGKAGLEPKPVAAVLGEQRSVSA